MFFLIIIILIIITGCTKEKIDCDKLDENKCLEYKEKCELCPKTMVSSYISCHSKEFCKNIPFE